MGGGRLTQTNEERSPAADEIPATSDRATVVCCIERGYLEEQSLLMLETLRRWGGPLGQSRVLAVMPRRDRRLSAKTVAALESLGAELRDGSPLNRLPWYNWYGKVVAAQVAEREATTPVVIWLDSDVLIFGPLVELGLPRGDDFTAFRDSPAAVLGNPSRRREYCEIAWETVGVDPKSPPRPSDDLPLADALDFNAGVYAFRRGLGFSETYAEHTLRLMRERYSAGGNFSFWMNEQIATATAMLSLGMRFRELPFAENHMVFGPCVNTSFENARVVHYGKMMFPPNWPEFMKRVERERPEFHERLLARGPILRPRVSWNPGYMARKIHRGLRSRMFRKQCVNATEARRARRVAALEP